MTRLPAATLARLRNLSLARLRDIGAVGFGVVIVLSVLAGGVTAVFYAASWVFGGSEPPAPSANPVLLGSFVDGNRIWHVRVKNESDKGGWTRVQFWDEDHTRRLVREPDATVWLKNTFTSEGSWGYTEVTETHPRSWTYYVWFDPRQEKKLELEINGRYASEGSTPKVVGVDYPSIDGTVR